MIPEKRIFKHDFESLTRSAVDKVAIASAATDRTWTYGELESLTGRIAAFLQKTGWNRDQPILSLLPDSVEQFLFFLAVLRAGGHFAPLSPMMRLNEILKMKDVLGISICVLPEHMEPSIRKGLSEAGLSTIVIRTDGSFEWLDMVTPRPVFAEWGGRSGTLYVASSGTTGDPKWIVFDMDVLWSSGVAFTKVHRFLDPDVRFYNILPMSYLGGLFNLGLIPLASGGSFVLPEAFSSGSLLGFWSDVERFKINILWLAPTLVRGLLKVRRRASTSNTLEASANIRASFLGMAPISRDMKEVFEKEFGFPLLENYALSETTFISSETLDNRFRRAEGSQGEMLPYVDVRFAESGEIEVRSPFLCKGYVQDEGEVDLPLSDDGFFKTGDLGGRDEKKQLLMLAGRLREVVKKGGYLVSLRELECIAERHALVTEASAVPVDHDFYGEDIVIFVRLSAGAPSAKTDLVQLRSWITGELARFKWPSQVIAVDEFPRTVSGKVQKRVLREWLLDKERALYALKI